ncbi:MAG: hypothetical protein AAFO29_15775 [Actinomycetota bacterium]
MFNTIVLPTMLGVATVAGAGMIVPQVARLHRTGTTDGVSATWIGVGIAMNLWWLAYAVAIGRLGLIPVSVGGAALYGVMALQLVGLLGPSALGPVARGHLIGLAPAAALVAGGWPAAGLTIGLLYGAVFAPAVWSALRSPSVAGISTVTWVLAWLEAVVWLIYGASTSDVALLVGGLGGTVMSSIILLRLGGARAWNPRRPIGVPAG